MQTNTNVLTRAALLVAVGFALSYLEHLVPLPLPVGLKLGLANVVTLFCLCTTSRKTTLAVLFLRCLLVALLFGSLSGLLFSLGGGICAFTAMCLCMKGYGKTVSLLGISVAGAAAHHIGQIVVAILYLQSSSIGSYLPILLFLSIPTGLLTGFVAALSVDRLQTIYRKDL